MPAMTTIDETMSRGDAEAGKPKVLVYIDRDMETTIYSSRSGKKTTGMKHTEEVTCYQTKDGTEETKDGKPAIVINREKIDWSLSVQGNTLESVTQWRETFEVGKGVQLGSRFLKTAEIYQTQLKDSKSQADILIPVAQDEWIAIHVEEALIETEGGENGNRGKIRPKDDLAKAVGSADGASAGDLFRGGMGSSGYTLEILNATRSKIVVEKNTD